MAVMELTKENFEKEVANQDKLVIVDFWADWCGPCKMLSPVIHEIADETPTVKICQVNVDKAQELAQKFRIVSIPTLLYIKDNKVIGQTVGYAPKDEILEAIAEHM